MELHEQLGQVNSREKLVAFVKALYQDLERNPSRWENITLPYYLESMAAWLEDSDMASLDAPTWKFVAQVLFAASVYE